MRLVSSILRRRLTGLSVRICVTRAARSVAKVVSTSVIASFVAHIPRFVFKKQKPNPHDDAACPRRRMAMSSVQALDRLGILFPHAMH